MCAAMKAEEDYFIIGGAAMYRAFCHWRTASI